MRRAEQLVHVIFSPSLLMRANLFRPACPHSGFPNPNVKKGDLRESLDCRCFVYFEDLAEYPPIVGDVFQPHAQAF